MDFAKIAKNLGRTINDNSPVILTGMAVAGTITTAIMAARAGAQAQNILDAHREDFEARDQYFGMQEKAQIVWKLYIPTIAMGTATVACVISANSINMRRNAAVMSAYTITDKAFQEYKEKVVEHIGEGPEQKVQDEIAADRMLRDEKGLSEIIELGSGHHLFHDQVTGRYFRSDMETVRKAVNDINQQCNSEVYASQNDFYRRIGLSEVAIGEELGWRSDHHLDIRFSTHISGDGEPCISMDYVVGPIRGYYKGY